MPYGKSLISVFLEFFASINKIFILAGRLGTRLSFCEVLELFLVRQLVSQLIYTMFISNNCVSFYMWWKEKLVKYQKVSKYYENVCRWLSQWWLVFDFLGFMLLRVMGLGFDNTCTVSGKWNVTRIISRLYGWPYKTLRPSKLVVEYSVVVMTAGSQSRRSQTESYG